MLLFLKNVMSNRAFRL